MSNINVVIRRVPILTRCLNRGPMGAYPSQLVVAALRPSRKSEWSLCSSGILKKMELKSSCDITGRDVAIVAFSTFMYCTQDKSEVSR